MKTIYYNNFENEGWEQKINESGFAGANGFCYNVQGEICIVYGDSKNYWNLPGGGREENETPLDTFVREVKEEAQAAVESVEFFSIISANLFEDDGVTELSYVEKLKHVEEPRNLLPGVRFFCKLINIEEFVPNKDGFEIEDRKFVTVEDLPNYIKYLAETENGRAQYEELKRRMKKIVLN